MEINFEREVQNLKTRLALENPYLLPLFFHLKVKKTERTDAPAFTTGKEIYLADAFFEFSNDEKYAILLHELGHNMLLHPFKRNKIFEQLKWEFKDYNPEAIEKAIVFAEEIQVNDLVEKMGGKLPPGAITKSFLPSDLADFYNDEKPTTEVLAKEILKQFPNHKKLDSDVIAENSTEENEREMKKVLGKVFILSKALKRGTERGEWEEIIEGILKPQIDWLKVLKKKIQKEFIAFNNKSWKRIHKKKSAFYNFDFVLPNWDYSEIFNLIIAIDTSGSMDEAQLKRVISEIFSLASQNKIKAKIKAIMCDADIQDVIDIKNKSDVQKVKKIKGRGGTSYTPVFNYILKNLKNKEKATLVYFTDGFGNQTEKEFKEAYKNAEKKLNAVYWAITEEDKIKEVVKDLEICNVR